MPSARTFPPAPAAHWLLSSMALVLAPHVLHLPAWASATAFALLAWRWAAAIGKAPLPGKWILVMLLIALSGAILFHFRSLFGRDAGVAMLTLMLALKLLEARSYRDAMFSVFLGYFLVIIYFVFAQSIPVAIYLLAVTLMLTATLVVLNHPVSARNWRQPMKLSGLMLAQAVPIMLVVFLLFPRIGGPLWGMPSDAFSARSGLSENMAPGSISQLVQSDAVSFRAVFADNPPPAPSLYWRALVLEKFDGRSWGRQRGRPAPENPIETIGNAVRYTVTIEPHNKHWVFALEMPDSGNLPPDTFLSSDLQLLSKRPLQRLARFSLTAYPEHRVGRALLPEELDSALALPASGNPQARELASRLRHDSASDAQIVSSVLRLFASGSYTYTLTPSLLGADSVDEFLFTTKSGFCEHYAGAFTFLMRAAGVPARVVTGYQGGEFNPAGGYYIVRQSDAHAWSEVWLNGRGWMRVDPTAMVAADRIENGIASALSEGEPLPFLLRTDMKWLKEMRQRWDAINSYWDQWVLNYDQEQQIGLFARLGFGIVSWQELAWGLGISTAVLLGIITLFALWPARKPATDKVQRLYLQFCRKLEKSGIARLPTEGPLDFAARVRIQRPELAATTDAVARLYVQLRYGQDARGDTLKKLDILIRSFRP